VLYISRLRHENLNHFGDLVEQTLVVHHLLGFHQLRDIGVKHYLTILTQVVLLEQSLFLLAAAVVVSYQLFGTAHQLVEMVTHLLPLARSHQNVFVAIALSYT